MIAKAFYESIFAAILTVLAPIEATMVVILVLANVDLITGVCAAIRRGDKITSSRLRDTIGKIFVYEIGLLTAFLLEKWLISSLLPTTKIVAAIIGTAEAKSIFENLDACYGGELFRTILDKLGSSNKEK